MLYEPENFDLRGVSAKGVHCDSPCSAIVSNLLVTLSSLPFDETGPAKCDSANCFSPVLKQSKSVIVVVELQSSLELESANRAAISTRGARNKSIKLTEFRLDRFHGTAPPLGHVERKCHPRDPPFLKKTESMRLTTKLHETNVNWTVPGQGGCLHAVVTVTGLRKAQT
jgi:hypothetical protein